MPPAAPNAPATPPLPTVGRVVWYVVPEGRGQGEIRPAVVVRVFARDDGEMPLVNLAVLLDGHNDRMERPSWPLALPELAKVNDADARAAFQQLHASLIESFDQLSSQRYVLWATSAQHDPAGLVLGSWHWMPFQLGQAARVDDLAQLRAQVQELLDGSARDAKRIAELEARIGQPAVGAELGEKAERPSYKRLP